MQKYLFPFLVFLVGFYLIGWQTVGWDFDGIPGDMGDGRLNNYFLEQGYLYLTGSINSYWDAGFFYPERQTMSMSDNLFGTLPLYALLRYVSLDRETAYQVWFLCLLSLNFFSCFICLKKLKIDPAAAAIGAYIFAFSLPVAGGLGHIQMLPKFALPLMLYCLIRFIQYQQSKHLFFFFFFTVYQVYCGIYLGLMGIIAAIILFFVFTIQLGFKTQIKSMGLFIKKKWISTTTFLLLHFLMLFILMRPYILRSGDVERTYMDPARGLPTLASYFFPPPGTILYNWLRPLEQFLSNSHEHTLFMGTTFVIGLIMSIYLIRTKKLNELKMWLVSLLVLMVLTLNISHYISLYILIYIIPGFQAIRAVSRIVQIELFFLAGLIAVILNYYLKSIPSKSKIFLLIGSIFSLMVLDQFIKQEGLMTFSKKESQQRVQQLKTTLLSKNVLKYDAFAYLPPTQEKVYKYQVDAMIAAQDLRIPTVNGYTAFEPKGYEEFFKKPDAYNLMILEKTKLENKYILIVGDESISSVQQ